VEDREIDLFQAMQGEDNLIGVCPQDTILLNKMKVKENLLYFARFKNMADPVAVVEKVLDDFNLRRIQDSWVQEISGG
jgi:ABC-2 type transport system ATP-binding protein